MTFIPDTKESLMDKLAGEYAFSHAVMDQKLSANLLLFAVKQAWLDGWVSCRREALKKVMELSLSDRIWPETRDRLIDVSTEMKKLGEAK